MGRLQAGVALASVATAALLAAVGAAPAQDALTAKLDPSGMIQVSRGGVELAMIELNAHAVNWQHAPQVTATAQASDLPDQAGKQFVGTLPIPNTNGGAIEFTETVTALQQGFRLEYDLGMTGGFRLSGLQFSAILPVAAYGGKEIAISQPGGEEEEIVGLPAEQSQQRFQLFNGQGAKIEVGKGTPEAVTLELLAAADVVVQDLRQWERDVFEVRFPAIMEDAGREMTTDDRFHLDLTVTFAAPVKLVGP